MFVQVDEIQTIGHVTYINLSTDKQSAFVSLDHNTGRVWVICKNAMHQIWKGCGRFFSSFDAARAGYKSAAMQAMLRAAEESVTTEPALLH